VSPVLPIGPTNATGAPALQNEAAGGNETFNNTTSPVSIFISNTLKYAVWSTASAIVTKQSADIKRLLSLDANLCAPVDPAAIDPFFAICVVTN
jgi:hypothetical protein